MGNIDVKKTSEAISRCSFLLQKIHTRVQCQMQYVHLLLPDKAKWYWGLDEQAAFEDMWQALVSYSVLQYLKQELSTRLNTDGSEHTL